MKITLIGSGSWASALANVIADNNHEAVVYGIVKEEVEDINFNHRNSKYFKDIKLNEKIKATLDIKEALDKTDMIILALPSQFIKKSLIDDIAPNLNSKPIIINVAKGFDMETHDRLSNVIRKSIDQNKIRGIVSLIGPSHAEEVVVRMFTAICAVSLNDDLALEVQKTFSNNYFRVYRHNDEVGAEYAVATKNVIALASGIIHGLGLGDNTRAALMTRGLAEMVRFGKAVGANERTYLGLTGIGDLIVTCSSHHSRNFTAGYEIGKLNDAKKFLENNKRTVEGINACKILHEESKKLGLEMPITSAVYSVIFEGAKPSDIVSLMMERELKVEHE